MLRKYTGQIEEKKNKQKALKFLERFKSLFLDSKREVVNSLVSLVISAINGAIKDEKTLNCEKEGHVFDQDGWKKVEWTTYEVVYIDRQIIPNYPVNHVIWRRKCPNCGFIEESLGEAEEVKVKREKEEKIEKIKKLKKELKELES